MPSEILSAAVSAASVSPDSSAASRVLRSVRKPVCSVSASAVSVLAVSLLVDVLPVRVSSAVCNALPAVSAVSVSPDWTDDRTVRKFSMKLEAASDD